jgi:putative membrane protein
MIRNFSDHAANERTFLAWIRTAISIMAFGFVIEKFDLFLKFAQVSTAPQLPHQLHDPLATLAGLVLMGLGAVVMGMATRRFLRTAKDIDSGELKQGSGARVDVALATMLVVLGCCLVVYLAQNLIANF